MFPPFLHHGGGNNKYFPKNFWRNEKEIVNLQRECVIK